MIQMRRDQTGKFIHTYKYERNFIGKIFVVRFCYHEKSPSIFPVGFCAANGITLTPPNGYDINTFRWDTYLEETKSLPADEHLFHRDIPDHGFRVCSLQTASNCRIYGSEYNIRIHYINSQICD